MIKIQSSVALVTGANRGIGLSLVRALASRGATRVYAVGRSREALAHAVSVAPDRITPLVADITDVEAVAELAARAPDVGLLFNNAGVLDFGSVLEAPIGAFERNFATNVYGLLNVSRAFAPGMVTRGNGAIVNLLTLVALASMPGLGVYNASKAAAWSLTQSMRANLAARGVSVVGVFPGAVDTDMLRGVDVPKTSPDDVARAVLDGVEAGREDIFPDPMSAELYCAWRADHKAIEKQFATM